MGTHRQLFDMSVEAPEVLMDPTVFDALLTSLDDPDPAPELADELSRLPKLR